MPAIAPCAAPRHEAPPAPGVDSVWLMRTLIESLETFRRRCRLPIPIPFDPGSRSRVPSYPSADTTGGVEKRSAKVCHDGAAEVPIPLSPLLVTVSFICSVSAPQGARAESLSRLLIVLARSQSPFEARAIAVIAQQVKAHTATVIYGF